MSNKKWTIIIALSCFLFSRADFAMAKEDFPKLANYYLKFFNRSDYEALYKWDLIIMPTEMAFYNEEFFNTYKTKKKDGLLISYVYPAMINNIDLRESVGLKWHLYEKVETNNWWLRDGARQKLEIWPNLYAVNLSKDAWQDFNVEYVKTKINLGRWDGIMYDTVDSTINHYNKNGSGIDMNGDGIKDDAAAVNKSWQASMAKLFKKTRDAIKDKVIMINGNSIASYQPHINGRMFETFPTPWEGNGSWSATMTQYLDRLPGQNAKPNIYVVNANTGNTWVMDNYRKMRFGLASTLLGDGYFSFDYGDKDHSQTWWYDEYSVKLGRAKSKAYNLLDKSNPAVKPGLWRRDFENGSAIVNSTAKKRKYVFSKEEFEKLKGTQDRRMNDGTRINWIELEPNDGVVLLKTGTDIVDESFSNGSFIRSFNEQGVETRNGFFSYQDTYPGNTQIATTDLDNDGYAETVVNGQGVITVYSRGAKKASFAPYGKNFKGTISFAVGDLNGDKLKEIVTGPGAGGGPHIRVFSSDGKLLSAGFFAFDQRERGGVNVAVGDINLDGRDEIIAGAGKGGSPIVRVFDSKGRKLREFAAYGDNLRSGISVAAGDVNNDGLTDIVTGPGAGSFPNVRVFSTYGKMLFQFFAYDKTSKAGIKVMTGDTNNDRKTEILVSTISLGN